MLEIYGQKTDRQLVAKQRIIAVAAGREKADLVLKNAKYLNVFSNEFLCGDIAVANGLIAGVGKYDGKTEIDVSGKLVLPGFIDAHIHLESSMVTPAEFAKAVVAHGTTTVITDPHEITNVMGIDGVEYMIQASQNLPIDVHFMMPSCVPATEIDESGAELDCKDIDLYLDNKKVLGLAEMMNYVGVINGDKNVLSKIVTSQAHHKKIDGHAPELSGNDLNAYIAAGVYSDHECSTFEKKNAEFDGAVTRDLKKLCWNYANLYFAYMTLSKNYSTHCDDMYMCTINNYLSLFNILKSLHDVPKMKQILLKETASVIKDIKRYVNIDFDGEKPLLSNHPAYNNALYECGNYLINVLDAKSDSFVERAKSILPLGDEAENEFREFGNDFSECYFTILAIAEKYFSITNSLSKKINEALSNDFKPDTIEWKEANKRAIEYGSKKKSLYKALAAFVVKVYRAISAVSGSSRKAFLIQTNKMLVSFRKIVDYRDKNTKTVLSDWSNYSTIWTGTNAILILELSAKFAYLHQMRLEKISNANGNKLSEDVLSTVCLQYNAWFQIYSGANVGTFDTDCMLVNHYVKYLDSILRLGAYTHTIIAETSNGNWRVCSELIKKLIQDERVSNEKKAEWNRLSVVMKSICDS